jgi:hypothetical protein
MRQTQPSAQAFFTTFVVFGAVSVALVLVVFLMDRAVAAKGAHIAAE